MRLYLLIGLGLGWQLQNLQGQAQHSGQHLHYINRPSSIYHCIRHSNLNHYQLSHMIRSSLQTEVFLYHFAANSLLCLLGVSGSFSNWFNTVRGAIKIYRYHNTFCLFFLSHNIVRQLLPTFLSFFQGLFTSDFALGYLTAKRYRSAETDDVILTILWRHCFINI